MSTMEKILSTQVIVVCVCVFCVVYAAVTNAPGWVIVMYTCIGYAGVRSIHWVREHVRINAPRMSPYDAHECPKCHHKYVTNILKSNDK
jgi:hypothetical protein